MPSDAPMPFRLGFFLERVGVTCFKWPSVPYRGIDRIPYLPTPEEEDELRSSGRGALADLWDRYSDARFSGKLNSNLSLAQGLLRDFLDEEIELEMVYAEIVMIPDDLHEYPRGMDWAELLTQSLQNIRPVHERLTGRPENLHFLGFDVAQLFESFLSAIFQPGLHETQPRLPDHLNRAGLFDDIDTASKFLRAANEMGYGPLPYCVLGIWQPG